MALDLTWRPTKTPAPINPDTNPMAKFFFGLFGWVGNNNKCTDDCVVFIAEFDVALFGRRHPRSGSNYCTNV